MDRFEISPPTARTWRPRFRLRTLLAVVAVACLALAAYSRQRWIVHHRDAALVELETRHGASVAFDERCWHPNELANHELIRAGDPAATLSRIRIFLGDRRVNEIMLRRRSPVAAGLLDAFPEAAVYAPVRSAAALAG
jgi:hypothetical protein